MEARQGLLERRARLHRQWERAAEHGSDQGPDGGTPDGVRPEIAASWVRSRVVVRPEVAAAPVGEVTASREVELLRRALLDVAPVLARAAEEGDLVVAVTDPAVRLLWTHGGRVMRRRAEAVGFVPGGCWDEASIGTNALDLALRQGAPARCWSAEHFTPVVHGWVCWAVPLVDPLTRRPLGVLDVSTLWDRAHPLGAATTTVLAAHVQAALDHLDGARTSTTRPATARPATARATSARATSTRPSAARGPAARPELALVLTGEHPRGAPARLDGRPLPVTPRQLEVLALLALHPAGLSADELHDALYGEAPVSRSTLKAEVSHLRAMLGGAIGSRPYRLDLDVRCDVHDVEAALRRGDVAAAVAAGCGSLLPHTESPRLRELRDRLDVARREALLAHPVPTAVLAHAEQHPGDDAVLEAALAVLDPADPLRPLLLAHLGAGPGAGPGAGAGGGPRAGATRAGAETVGAGRAVARRAAGSPSRTNRAPTTAA